MRTIWQLLLAFALATTGWAGSSTTHLYIPHCGIPASVGENSYLTNTLQCWDFIACQGVTNATQIATRMGNGTIGAGTTPTLGISIYSADGNTQIVEAVEVIDDTREQTNIVYDSLRAWNGSSEATITDFDLVDGTMYRLCVCASANTAGEYVTGNQSAGVLVPIANAFVTHIGTAANSCSTGNPPNTTGSLSTSTINPAHVLLGTATP